MNAYPHMAHEFASDRAAALRAEAHNDRMARAASARRNLLQAVLNALRPAHKPALRTSRA